MTYKRYRIVVNVSESNVYEVEASNEDEARDLVLDGRFDYERQIDRSSDVVSVEVIPEIGEVKNG